MPPLKQKPVTKEQYEAERWVLGQRKRLYKNFNAIGRFTFGLIDMIGTEDRKTIRTWQGNSSDCITSRQLSYINPDTHDTYGIQLSVAALHQLIRVPHLPPRTFFGVGATLVAEGGTPQTMNLNVGEFLAAFRLEHPTLPYAYDGSVRDQVKIEQFTKVVGLVEQLMRGASLLEQTDAPEPILQAFNDTPVNGIDMYL